ncbi:YrdC domain-containing protein, mitochondrial-like protein [Tanacetum coccineum]
MYTINPTKITSKLPILNPTTGVHRFAFSRTIQQQKNRFLKLGLVSKAARCAVIRPANEGCLDEAIEAIKDGKVIAVPTDTLYGFACDAW